MAAVSIATPFLVIDYWSRWFEMPNVLVIAQVPLATTIFGGLFFWSLRRGHERQTFFIALHCFALAFAGLGISLWPYAVPRSVTIRGAVPPASSQTFLLAGTAVILPVIMAYTSWAYWGLSRKGRRGVSLMQEAPSPKALWQRLAWMAGLRQMNVASLALASAIIRLWMRP